MGQRLTSAFWTRAVSGLLGGPECAILRRMRIALYEPDIPQNAGTILRLAACLGVEAHIIEPAGFPVTDRAFRRAGMDYLDQVSITRHAGWDDFEGWRRRETRPADPVHDARQRLLSRPRVPPRRRAAVRPRVRPACPTACTTPPTRGWSSRSGRACARSMWRSPAPWRLAKRCGRRAKANREAPSVGGNS